MTIRDGFTLGSWTIYPLEGRLAGDGEECRVQPKSMDVLLFLADAGGSVVERETLLLGVWGERAQSDEPLTRCIGELRRALGDTRGEPEYIRTVPKRGYQLLQPAEELLIEPDNAAAPQLTEPQHKMRMGTVKKIAIGAAILLIAALLEVFIERTLENSDADGAQNHAPSVSAVAAPKLSIAVLPFVNISSDEEQEYFSDGISEELMNLLAQIPGLKVTSSWSSFSYKGKDISIPMVAAQLNVAHILAGSVRKEGEVIRITVRLIDTQADSLLWSESYERVLDDIFETQDEIAASVVAQLKIELQDDAPSVKATNSEAYALVLQARYLHRQSTPDALARSIELFKKAVVVDPEYAAAWAGLALEYMSQADTALLPFEESYKSAREAANRALALDATNAAAHRSLGWIARNYDRDFATAAMHFERALAMEPTNVDSISNAGFMALYLGRLDQSVALGEFMIARDPVSAIGNSELGIFYMYAGRIDDAIASFRTTLTLSPGYLGGNYLIGMALLLKNEPQAALAAMENEVDEAWRLIGLTMAHHALGDTLAADAALRELIEKAGEIAAFNIAYVMSFRGEADKAFEWLDMADERNDPGLTEIVVHPFFANIHSDRRWIPFLESLGMAPEQLDSIAFDAKPPQQ